MCAKVRRRVGTLSCSSEARRRLWAGAVEGPSDPALTRAQIETSWAQRRPQVRETSMTVVTLLSRFTAGHADEVLSAGRAALAEGAPLRVDASAVERAATPALQTLAGVAAATGVRLEAASPDFLEALERLGLAGLFEGAGDADADAARDAETMA